MRKSIFIIITCIILLFSLSNCKSNDDKEGKEIKDMAGRTVKLPDKVSKAFATLPSGTMFIYSIDPELLVGYNYDFNEEEKVFILEEYHDLKSYGQGGKINKEALIAANPDVIIMYGEINDSEKESADILEDDTGIPVVMVDGSLEKSPEAYRFLGEKVFNMKERTDILATYAEEALEFAEEIKTTYADKKVKLYYGNGPDSLETTPIGSTHAELFVLIGAVNVCDLELNAKGRVEASHEHIIAWNPDIVLINGEPKGDKKISPKMAVDNFKSDERFQTINAVINDRVYAIPNYPYTWIDRPQSTNRLLGIYWLAYILYDHDSIDVNEEAKTFYELFYHWDLTDEELTLLLGK